MNKKLKTSRENYIWLMGGKEKFSLRHRMGLVEPQSSLFPPFYFIHKANFSFIQQTLEEFFPHRALSKSISPKYYRLSIDKIPNDW
jgi:hypothetical protein